MLCREDNHRTEVIPVRQKRYPLLQDGVLGRRARARRRLEEVSVRQLRDGVCQRGEERRQVREGGEAQVRHL